MPVAYTVAANVIDIRTDIPQSSDCLLVDTNAWAWSFYPSSTVSPVGNPVPQASVYSAYLVRVKLAGAVQYRAASCFVELISLIEHVEHEAYSAALGAIPFKDYRHNLPTERSRVVAEMQRVWGRVLAESVLLPLALDDVVFGSAAARLASARVDAADLLLLEAMAVHGVRQLVSDDGDFCTVPGIDLFTANSRVLSAARSQGRLVTR